MKLPLVCFGFFALVGVISAPSATTESGTPVSDYKVVRVAKVGGAGGFDYVYADADGRKLYVPRGNRIPVYDLDTLKSLGEIGALNNVHGAVVDPKSHHGFSSSKPVAMWDTQSLTTVKTIEVEGGPDGILFDPQTQHVFVLSHRAPNVTVIDSRDGSIVGTIDIGGAPEQGAVDNDGRIYIDVEDKDTVAVIDGKSLKVVGHYELGGKGKTPAGLALDPKNHILFVFCRNPATCVILDANDGKIISTLPIGAGTDGGAFNPNTLEAFSSQRDGTLTVIKEVSPTEFKVEQNVSTQPGAKTCTLDTKTNQIYLITAEFAPPPASTAAASPAPAGANRPSRNGRGEMVADSFSILVVGK